VCIGKLCETRTATVTRSGVGGALANPETRSYTVYDVAGRATESLTEVDAQSFASFTTFDANGRVDQVMQLAAGNRQRPAEAAGLERWRADSPLSRARSCRVPGRFSLPRTSRSADLRRDLREISSRMAR